MNPINKASLARLQRKSAKPEKNIIYSSSVSEIHLMLPIPPSVNQIYTGYPRRRKSDIYKDWISQAHAALKQFPVLNISGRFSLEYRFARPNDKRRRDVGNYEKPLTDFLVSAGVIDDDSNAEKITSQWCDKLSPRLVSVLIKKTERATR